MLSKYIYQSKIIYIAIWFQSTMVLFLNILEKIFLGLLRFWSIYILYAKLTVILVLPIGSHLFDKLIKSFMKLVFSNINSLFTVHQSSSFPSLTSFCTSISTLVAMQQSKEVANYKLTYDSIILLKHLNKTNSQKETITCKILMDKHVSYPKKHPQIHWDPLNVEYPVRLATQPVISSENIARKWRAQLEVLPEQTRNRIVDMKEHSRGYSTCEKLWRSQTSLDFGYKNSEMRRHNKDTSCDENKYIYQSSKSLAHRPPTCRAYGTTEMKHSYTTPIAPSRLVTDKDQFKHPASLESDIELVERCWHNELEPIDTTHDGFEKYLDPYLTTSRLHHRPYTADQLKKISNSRDIATYYTLTDVHWVWSTKPKHDEFFPRVRGPKQMCDREKFKGNFREIITHNKLQWLPGSFRTENKDNFALSRPLGNNLDEREEEVRSSYKQSVAKLKANIHHEDSYIKRGYRTESAQIGSKKQTCAIFEQCVEKNKRLS